MVIEALQRIPINGGAVRAIHPINNPFSPTIILFPISSIHLKLHNFINSIENNYNVPHLAREM